MAVRPTVTEVTDRQVHYLINPAAARLGVCSVCWTFCTGHERCYRCEHDPRWTTAVAPISLSVHGGQLHDVLRGYKTLGGQQGKLLQRDVIAMLWRFLRDHESCLAERCDVDTFPLVTTVPSGSKRRDVDHPLRTIVGEYVRPTASRYERLLTRSTAEVSERTVDPAKYDANRSINGQAVLLIDDTWTTGANVQSAAGALAGAGAGAIGVVVLGRHVRPDFADHADQLRRLPRRFSWSRCVHHC